MWEEMKKIKIIFIVSMFNFLIGGFCYNGKIELVMEKFDEFVESGLFFDDIIFNLIVFGYCKEGCVEKVFEFYNESVRYFFKFDSYMCNIFFNGFCKEGMIEKVFNFFNLFIEEREVDMVMYNMMIFGFCKDRKVKEVFDFLLEMEEKKLEFDWFIYNSIVIVFMEDGKLSEVEELLEKVFLKFGSAKQSLQGETYENVESKEEFNNIEGIVYFDVINEFCSRGRLKGVIVEVIQSEGKIFFFFGVGFFG